VPDRSLRRPGGHGRAAALAVVALVVGFAGCGGGGDATSASSTVAQGTTSSTSSSTTTSSTTGTGAGGPRTKPVSPQDRVRTAVEAVLTSDDPADVCGRYVTEHFLSVAYGSRQGCVQAQAPDSAASSLGSYSAEIHGQTATAVAKPTGGPYDGARITVTLVGGPSFQVDGLRSNVPVGP
jgi:hypothetical protein